MVYFRGCILVGRGVFAKTFLVVTKSNGIFFLFLMRAPSQSERLKENSFVDVVQPRSIDGGLNLDLHDFATTWLIEIANNYLYMQRI